MGLELKATGGRLTYIRETGRLPEPPDDGDGPVGAIVLLIGCGLIALVLWLGR